MKYFVVNSFTDALFSGNPAGVCLVDAFPEDMLMQRIAAENRLSETAFVTPAGGDFALRWFTPKAEVELCGHATLATAFVLLTRTHPHLPRAVFHTLSGALTVTRAGDRFEMDFPAREQAQMEVTREIARAIDKPVLEAYGGYNLMLLLGSEEDVRTAVPRLDAMLRLSDYHGVIITARGSDVDFVSRFFAPAMGIDEDPVTGSTHTSLAPYWGARLGKEALTARQVSARGGVLWCRQEGARVTISGEACLYSVGGLYV